MMNTVKKTACALAVLATTTAVMAESIDVKVIGTITPTACKPTLSGGGVIDYGVIPPKSLKKDSFTYLDVKQVEFSISCDAPAKLALKAQTQRHSSALSLNGRVWNVANKIPLFGGEYDTHGLGLTNNKSIGGFGLRFDTSSITADSINVDSIIKDDGNDLWAKSSNGSLIKSGGVQRLYSWSKAGGEATPIAFTNLTGKIEAQAYINKLAELDITNPVQLDGLTTLELVYL